jgi:hypothetical protein
MTEGPSNSFQYEECDMPDGVSLSEWRRRNVKPDHRRAQVTSGVLAALATLAPIVLSVRGSRRR